MKRIIAVLPVLLLAVPVIVSAHQHAAYEIGGVEYEFVVGSLDEPVAVDDKTGVDLRVSTAGHEETEANDHHVAGGGVAGLETSLQVELIAGDKKKILDLSPAWNDPGAYEAPFYPTVATALSYRFFGEINNTAVDLTFTCLPEGQEAQEEGEKVISEGVKQISKSGGFGCPDPKEDMGFPEKSASIVSVNKSSDMGMWGIGFGILGTALGLIAISRRRA